MLPIASMKELTHHASSRDMSDLTAYICCWMYPDQAAAPCDPGPSSARRRTNFSRSSGPCTGVAREP